VEAGSVLATWFILRDLLVTADDKLLLRDLDEKHS